MNYGTTFQNGTLQPETNDPNRPLGPLVEVDDNADTTILLDFANPLTVQLSFLDNTKAASRSFYVGSNPTIDLNTCQTLIAELEFDQPITMAPMADPEPTWSVALHFKTEDPQDWKYGATCRFNNGGNVNMGFTTMVGGNPVQTSTYAKLQNTTFKMRIAISRDSTMVAEQSATLTITTPTADPAKPTVSVFSADVSPDSGKNAAGTSNPAADPIRALANAAANPLTQVGFALVQVSNGGTSAVSIRFLKFTLFYVACPEIPAPPSGTNSNPNPTSAPLQDTNPERAALSWILIQLILHPGDPPLDRRFLQELWNRMSPAERDHLISFEIRELSHLMENHALARRIQQTINKSHPSGS